MPHDVEPLAPRQDASLVLSADQRRGGDADVLALLGVFTLADAMLVLLWMLT